MTELLPCSKCRRVPEWQTTHGMGGEVVRRLRCLCGNRTHYFSDEARAESHWNRVCGSPLTLAERPQDEPACERSRMDAATDVPLFGTAVRDESGAWVDPAAALDDEDEPAEGDGVRVLSTWARCDGGPCGGCS